MKLCFKSTKTKTLTRQEGGSVFIVVLLTMAVLALLAAHVCRVATTRYRACFEMASWHEAGATAEAGADVAVAALRSGTWTGWQGPDSNGVRTYNVPALTHAGEGNTSTTAVVKVDSPSSFTTSIGKYYRIRSAGTATVMGKANSRYDKYDNRLRHLSFVWDRDTGASVSTPFVSRTVEVIARPVGLYARPLTLLGAINANQSGSYIDSFDSTDPTKSTNGFYDPAKRQLHGNIGSLDSTGSDLKGLYIYGDLLYSGPGVPNSYNVQGSIITPFSEPTLPVNKPTWSAVTANLGNITSNQSWQAGPVGSPTQYKLSGLKLPSNSTITLKPAPSGAGESEIEIWITGDMDTSAGGTIVASPGVKVTFYVEGQVTLTGNSIVNQSNVATAINLLGVTPSDYTSRTFQIGGSAKFIGVVNAPAYTIKLNGGGEFYGAFIGKDLKMSGGNTAIHYDESLWGYGGGPLYQTVSWIEGVR